MKKIPLYMINGALGAGKTTLLRYLLQQIEFSEARVIENEFASESVDTALVAAHAQEVATIAGVCICCSSDDELVTALRAFAKTSAAPVIIESTGVAHTLKVIEQLVVNDVFEQYDLAQVLYVVDALELAEEYHLPESLRREAEAADLVLVSKLDQVPVDQRRQLYQALQAQGLSRLAAMDHGVFALSELGDSSHILAYFTEADGEIAMSDTPTYSVIDMAALKVTPPQLEALWPRLCDRYGLRRLKGSVTDGVRSWHVEATPRQFRADAGGKALKLVLIGERACDISRQTLLRELAA